jgi:hypothetical protein
MHGPPNAKEIEHSRCICRIILLTEVFRSSVKVFFSPPPESKISPVDRNRSSLRYIVFLSESWTTVEVLQPAITCVKYRHPYPFMIDTKTVLCCRGKGIGVWRDAVTMRYCGRNGSGIDRRQMINVKNEHGGYSQRLCAALFYIVIITTIIIIIC